jgi:hypothetical protein
VPQRMENHLVIRIFHVMPCQSVEVYVIRANTRTESRGPEGFYTDPNLLVSGHDGNAVQCSFPTDTLFDTD